MYYVYVYRDPRPNKNNVPVYVGKGVNDRAYQHWVRPDKCHNPQLKHLLNLLKRESLEPVIQIVFYTESEDEAFAKEIELIALFGRKDQKKGTLFNYTDGGDGFSNIGEEAMARRNASIKATYNTPEKKEEQSEKSLLLWANPTIRGKLLASIHRNAADPQYREKLSVTISAARGTEESREKTSIASTDNWQNPEYREKWSESHAEAMKSEEELSRKSAATKSGWENTETRRKRSEGIKASRSTEESRAKTRAQQETQWTEEARAAQSALAVEKLKDPMVKARSRVANAFNWAKRKNTPMSILHHPSN
jgi:hypothetical protein